MSQSLAVVQQLYRYPVKSMQGEAVEQLRISGGHVAGDRQWAVCDPATGFTLSAKRHGALLTCLSRSSGNDPDDETTVVVEVPGLGEHEAGSEGADTALSELLGRPVELSRPGAGSPPIELLVDPLDEGSEVISFPAPAGHFADLADADFLTTASLRAAAELHPDGDWDVRRFRPTALVEAPGEGFVEDAWVGTTVAAGDGASFEVFMPTVRCSLPPRPQPGLERDNAVVRVLKDHHDMSLGVYAAARRDGTMRIGDELRIVSPISD